MELLDVAPRSEVLASARSRLMEGSTMIMRMRGLLKCEFVVARLFVYNSPQTQRRADKIGDVLKMIRIIII